MFYFTICFADFTWFVKYITSLESEILFYLTTFYSSASSLTSGNDESPEVIPAIQASVIVTSAIRAAVIMTWRLFVMSWLHRLHTLDKSDTSVAYRCREVGTYSCLVGRAILFDRAFTGYILFLFCLIEIVRGFFFMKPHFNRDVRIKFFSSSYSFTRSMFYPSCEWYGKGKIVSIIIMVLLISVVRHHTFLNFLLVLSSLFRWCDLMFAFRV